jgi:tRNA nucleotidyltransferase (CCA-adding enzyme)
MKEILNSLVKAGGRPLFVGGCVRDELLGIKNSKDIDVEVYGLSADNMVAVLSKFGKIDIVGVSFGVIKLSTKHGDFDFTLPRTDSKIAEGHKGFIVEVDHNMTLKEAASRRDFTINSISKNMDGELLDPYNGIDDLKAGVLRATSENFKDDPLRVLRGFQFASRFNMTVETETAKMCQGLLSEAHTIAVERIYGEVLKWALNSVVPSKGLYFLRDTGWLKLFPQLEHINGLPQDSKTHPEGCCFTHTSFVCDAARDIAVRDNLCDDDRLVLMLAALCHDIGKHGTTVIINGRWRAPGHAKEGSHLTQTLLESMGFGEVVIKKVIPLVAEHMAHVRTEVTDRFVRRLACRVLPSNITMLHKLIEADHSGRPPLSRHVPENANKILTVAKNLGITHNRPEPIVKGRHLIVEGMEPGPHFKELLEKCYQAQLDGKFTTLREGLLLV